MRNKWGINETKNTIFNKSVCVWFKRKETNFLKVHDFSLKLFSALITLSAYIEKEWKPYSIYYDLETTDTPKYVEVLFYAFSDFAMLWCLSNGRTEFVELVKEKVWY